MPLHVIVLALAGGLSVASAPVFHFELTKSTPAANATLTAPPARLQLWFSQAPAEGVSQLTLTGEDTKPVALGKTVIVAAEKSMYADPAKPLAPGKYTLHWRGAGDDGHVQSGDILFSVAKLP